MSDLLCVISWHKDGFWQADVFSDLDSESPEWFCTGKRGDEVWGVVNTTAQEFGGKIKFVQGYCGECAGCGCEFIKPIAECECGGDVQEYT